MRPEDILLEIKVQLLNIGEHGFVDMVDMLSDFGHGDNLSKIELMNALTKSGIFLSLVQLSTLVRTFDKDGSGQLSISAFTDAVEGSFSKRRLDLLQKVFNKIDERGVGRVDYKEIMNHFDPNGHPSVKASILSAEVVEDRMSLVFMGAEQRGALTFDDFAKYYSRISATIPHNDDLFCEVVCGVWHVAEKIEQTYVTKDDPRVLTMMKILKEKVRQKSSTSMGNVSTTLYKLFKFFDTNKNDSISISEWQNAMERLGVVVDKNLSKQVFECYAGDDKVLDYKEFVRMLFSNPNKDTAPHGHRLLA